MLIFLTQTPNLPLPSLKGYTQTETLLVPASLLLLLLFLLLFIITDGYCYSQVDLVGFQVACV